MKCPKCETELTRSPISEEPESSLGLPLAQVLPIIMESRCPKCGYTERETIPATFTEIKACPKCEQEKYVVKKKDTKAITKVGYFYYCRKCKLEFPARWG